MPHLFAPFRILPHTVMAVAAFTSVSGAVAQAAVSPAPISSIPQYGKFETSFTLPSQIGNPFDPRDNDVNAVVTGPGGVHETTPAFWDGDRWRLRYAPAKIGVYSLAFTRNGQSVRPIALTAAKFKCVVSRDSGFVRRNSKIVQSFVFDNAQPYYPLGIDVAWTNTGDSDYPVYFAKMGASHLNWARVWTTAWDGKNLEWSPDKAKNPKRGEFLMDAARRWDLVFDSAAAHGVYVQMVLQHHGQYTEKTDPNWKDNPFNAANGGFLQKPDDFFTNSEAKRLTKAKYRYIVARWGYSDHLLSYELFNEVQNIGEAQSHFQDVVDWHKEMTAYLRSIDTNHHLITTSNSDPGTPLSQIGLDYDQMHTYPPDVVSTFSALNTAGLKTPVFYGEWGPPDAAPAEVERMVHDGLWAGMMTPAAGAGQYWFWDKVMGQNFWPHFASAGSFLQAFHVPGLLATRRIDPVVEAVGARGDLSFAPSGGWEPTTRRDIPLPPGGAPNLSGVSSFIQGSGNRTLLPGPITFHLNAAAPCQFQVSVGTVSKGGAHLTLSLDGKLASEQDFPSGGADHDVSQSIRIDVPAGAHLVSLYNTGPDWFVAKRIVVTGYSPAVAILARGADRSAVFYAYTRDRLTSTPQNATLRFSHLVPGRYQVRLWNVAEGRPSTHFAARAAADGTLAVPLRGFVHDIAGVVAPEGPTAQ